MENSFTREMKKQHDSFLGSFESYRDQLTDVLFYGERISRSDLTEGKNRVIRGLRDQIESVKGILLPAVTNSGETPKVKGVELFADVQDNLLEIASRTEENVEYFANPDAPKEERNDAARETLKDLYRLDSTLALYFNLLENHLLEAGAAELETDEKEDLLAPLQKFAEE